MCLSAIIKPFNISFSTTVKGIPVCARETLIPLLNIKLKFLCIILHFCKQLHLSSSFHTLHLLPPYSNVSCLFKEHHIIFCNYFILFNKLLSVSMCVFLNAGNDFLSEPSLPLHASENFALSSWSYH